MNPSASLSAAPVLTVTAFIDLWAVYQAAEQKAANLWQQWRMMRSVAATDGTAGQLYAQAYSAQQAADTAYQAFLDSQKLLYGARG